MTDSTRDDTPPPAGETPDEEPATETAAAPDADADAKPDIDEMKRKFREALDAKRQGRSENSGTSGRDAGRIHGASGPAGGRRSFRRKSG